MEHPGNDGVRYRVNITAHEDPSTAGLRDFDVVSDQYYLFGLAHEDDFDRPTELTRDLRRDGKLTVFLRDLGIVLALSALGRNAEAHPALAAHPVAGVSLRNTRASRRNRSQVLSFHQKLHYPQASFDVAGGIR